MNTISILIPTTGERLGSLEALMESIDGQRLMPVEILVCGNLYDTRLVEAVQLWKHKFPRLMNLLHLEFTKVEGVNVARNLGIDKSRGEILLFLDDDCCLPDETFLYEHDRLHREHADVVGVGGPYQLKKPHGLLQRAYHWNAHYWLHVQNAAEYPLQLLGGNLSFKRSLLKEERFFEQIRFGGSETDLLLRLQAAGKKLLWADSAWIYHDPDVTLQTFLRKSFLQGYSLGRRLQQGLQKSETPANLPSLWNYLRSQGVSWSSLPALVWTISLFDLGFGWGLEYSYRYPALLSPAVGLSPFILNQALKMTGLPWAIDRFRRLRTMLRALMLLKAKEK